MKKPQKKSRANSSAAAHNRTVQTQPLHLDEYLNFLLPGFDKTTPPIWPPDVFALCMAPLWKSAAYTSVLSHRPLAKL